MNECFKCEKSGLLKMMIKSQFVMQILKFMMHVNIKIDCLDKMRQESKDKRDK